MNDTPNLALPYILPAQAQKHVTHNEAIKALDCLVQLSVESRSLTAPPAGPAEGSRYLVATAATGVWTGQSDKIAAFQDGAWAFFEPREGWVAWVSDDHELAIYSAGSWASFGGGGVITELDDLHHVGINATANTTNRLSLRSPASLFDNEGNGHQQKINKHAAGDTASVLYQTNYSGRAEMGLTGDDDFHFKVSADGSAWHEAIKIDRSTGKVSHPAGGPTQQIFTSSGTWTKPAGCVKIKVTLLGGGGGGGGSLGGSSTCGYGGGGGAGGFAIAWLDAASLTSETITIGSGGTGVSGSSGSNGGTSSFGSHCQATGGTGGPSVAAGTSVNLTIPANSGAGSSGDINGGGFVGSSAYRSSGTSAVSGGGSSGIFGGGAGGRASAGGGSNASGPGGGGGGAVSYDATSRLGGTGGAGLIVVEELYA